MPEIRIRSNAQALLLVLLLIGLLVGAGCTGRHDAAPLTAVPAVAQDDSQFVGDAACQPCHQAEFDMHRTSRHALTMRPADVHSLGAFAPAAGPIAQSHYTLRAEPAGSLRFERSDKPEMGATLGYALGSGKDAITFIGEFKPESLTEFRMTYLPPQRQWCLTPGQQTSPNLSLGNVHQMGLAVKCVRCHAVKTKPGTTEPAPGFLGVGCESCHGPGAEHIKVMQSGGTGDLKMADMRQWGAARIDAMCSRCHRSINDITIDGVDASATSRFQGYALEISPCFKQSHDRLSCVTCHNPHTSVSTDNARYEKVCLTCHGPAASAQGKACPVNPRTGCIPCHMPRRPIMLDERLPITMADHLILAYPVKK
jgi:hypothetical protein